MKKSYFTWLAFQQRIHETSVATKIRKRPLAVSNKKIIDWSLSITEWKRLKTSIYNTSNEGFIENSEILLVKYTNVAIYELLDILTVFHIICMYLKWKILSLKVNTKVNIIHSNTLEMYFIEWASNWAHTYLCSPCS